MRLRLKQILAEMGWTYGALSEKSGIPVRTIEEFIKRGGGRSENLIIFANVLGLKVSDLYEDEDESFDGETLESAVSLEKLNEAARHIFEAGAAEDAELRDLNIKNAQKILSPFLPGFDGTESYETLINEAKSRLIDARDIYHLSFILNKEKIDSGDAENYAELSKIMSSFTETGKYCGQILNIRKSVLRKKLES